ncbi:MAG TPA: DVUA0089 family protein [Bryobacteraceae bacterium]|nr:DVUA0089 family protein [Bryobacteraceae bacterium]
MRTSICICALLLSLSLVPVCSANLIVANNAGSTIATAEDLTGLGLFPTEITGTLSGTNPNDVSIFKIVNREPLDFSAFTRLPGAFGIPDTVLSLFNSSGVGVLMNDDISGSNTLSCLPSAGVSNPCPTSGAALPAGIYFLAISRSFNYPLDTLSNEIFNPVSSTDVVGPSSTDPLGGWDGNAAANPDTDLVNYDIVLNGTVPEPATWLLLMSAGLGIGILRRRRS